MFRLRGRDGAWRRFETVGRVVGRPAGHRGATAVARALVLHLRDVGGRRSAELELERLAYTDYLTGLPNRARLMAALTSARARARPAARGCLLLLDLDGFKPVNDVVGHEAGDSCWSRWPRGCAPPSATGTWSAGSAATSSPSSSRADLEEATALAERIVADLRACTRAQAPGWHRRRPVFDVSGSVGVTALHPADYVPTTIRQADLALRAAKSAGKNCVRPRGRRPTARPAGAPGSPATFPRALELDQFRVVYQPVVGVAERRASG